MGTKNIDIIELLFNVEKTYLDNKFRTIDVGRTREVDGFTETTLRSYIRISATNDDMELDEAFLCDMRIDKNNQFFLPYDEVIRILKLAKEQIDDILEWVEKFDWVKDEIQVYVDENERIDTVLRFLKEAKALRKESSQLNKLIKKVEKEHNKKEVVKK